MSIIEDERVTQAVIRGRVEGVAGLEAGKEELGEDPGVLEIVQYLLAGQFLRLGIRRECSLPSDPNPGQPDFSGDTPVHQLSGLGPWNGSCGLMGRDGRSNSRLGLRVVFSQGSWILSTDYFRYIEPIADPHSYQRQNRGDFVWPKPGSTRSP